MRADYNILLVDDCDAVRFLVTSIMNGQGYNVTTAANGQEAFDLLIASPSFDLIVLDLTMPIMGGLAFRKKVMAHPQLRDIPTIIYSSDSETLEISRMLGCWHVSPKVPENLLEKVLELLPPPQGT